MSEIVERVAEAIYDITNHWDHDDQLPPYSTLPEGWKAQWQDAACAAIAAMRELTPAMEDAGMDANPRGRTISDSDLRLIFTAMIDAALEAPALPPAPNGE